MYPSSSPTEIMHTYWRERVSTSTKEIGGKEMERGHYRWWRNHKKKSREMKGGKKRKYYRQQTVERSVACIFLFFFS